MSTYVGNKISEVDAQRLVSYLVVFHVILGPSVDAAQQPGHLWK